MKKETFKHPVVSCKVKYKTEQFPHLRKPLWFFVLSGLIVMAQTVGYIVQCWWQTFWMSKHPISKSMDAASHKQCSPPFSPPIHMKKGPQNTSLPCKLACSINELCMVSTAMNLPALVVLQPDMEKRWMHTRRQQAECLLLWCLQYLLLTCPLPGFTSQC